MPQVLKLFTVLVLAGLAAGYLFVLSPVFAIQSVEIKGASVVPVEEATRTAHEAAESRIGGMSVKSLVVADPERISDELKDSYGAVSKVSVTKKWPNKLTIELSERERSVVWKSKENLYLVDPSGTAYVQTPGQPEVTIIEDLTGLPVEVGKPVAGGSFIKIVGEIRQGLEAGGIRTPTFRVTETTFEVQAVAAEGYYILFDTTRPVASQIQAALAAVKQARPAQYADVRVPGRVYVR